MRAFRVLAITLLSFSCLLGRAYAQPVGYNGWDLERQAEKSQSEPDVAPSDGELWVIRPRGPIGAGWRQALGQSGLNPIAYLPRGAYLVEVQDAARMRSRFLSSKGSPDLLIRVRPEWKIDPVLADVARTQGIRDEVSVVIHATQLSPDLIDAAEAAGGRVTSQPKTPGKARLGVRVYDKALPKFLEAMSRRNDVYSLEPGGGARLFNDAAAPIVQSGSVSGGRPIWSRGLRGEGQIIAVLDTGLDYDSCFFAEDDGTSPPVVLGTGTGFPDLNRRKVVVYDLLEDADFGLLPGSSFDNEGHGTSVAGNATGSRLDDPFGTTVKNGMAPAAQLVVQDAGYGIDNCADLSALGCPVVDLTPFLDQAVAQGADFHNNSWGDREEFIPKNTYTAPTADMDDATWRHPEFLIVCAAGNDQNEGIDSVASPGIGKNVLSVGATRSPLFSGSAELLTSFSSLGWASDGRIKPDLTAPGQTYTAASDGNVLTQNCEFRAVQGTSMASPITAGSTALVRQYFTDGFYPSGVSRFDDRFSPSAALVKATLLNGAVDMTETSTFPPNRYEGWGRVHLENSLYFEGDARRIIATDARDHFTTSSLEPWTIRVDAVGNPQAGPLRFTLVWTDYPADPAASVTLVNDLDLVVEDLAQGQTYYGNQIDSSITGGGFSTAGGSLDTLNNVEMVVLPPESQGTFDVHIVPSLLVEAPQGFALVIGGAVYTHGSLLLAEGWVLY
jgi:hypothetical protein